MSDVESARYWLAWIERGGTIALLLVALGVGYEFVADRLAAPLRRTIETAREAKIAVLNKDVEDAKLKQLEAERDLETLRTKVYWRHIGQGKFLDSLRGKPKPTKVDILYLRDDVESWNLACEIHLCLHMAGWPVSWPPEPIKPREDVPFSHFPSVLGVGGSPGFGVALVTSDVDFKVSPWTWDEDKTAFGALVKAFRESLAEPVIVNRLAPEEGTLPAGVIRIVVGPRNPHLAYAKPHTQ